MGQIQDSVEAFLARVEWAYERHPEDTALAVQIGGDNGRFALYIEIDEGRKQIVAYSLCPVRCPAEKRAAMAELTSRVNWGLVLGNFDLDMDHGDVRFKTSADVEGFTFTPDCCAGILYPNVLTLDRYLPAIMGVIYGDQPPAVLVARVEAAPAPA
jgi:hypothetical protein